MSQLRVSRDEYRRIGRELAQADSMLGADVMAYALRSYKNGGVFGRVRVKASPTLPTKIRVPKNGNELRYLFLFQILVDVVSIVLETAPVILLILSTLAFISFNSKDSSRQPYGLWLLESISHLTVDALYARWVSFPLSLFTMFYYLYGAWTGSNSSSLRVN